MITKITIAAMSVLIFLMPAWAYACPYCAGRYDAGMSRGVVIGSMIAVPFLIFGITLSVIIRIIRRHKNNAMIDINRV